MLSELYVELLMYASSLLCGFTLDAGANQFNVTGFHSPSNRTLDQDCHRRQDPLSLERGPG